MRAALALCAATVVMACRYQPTPVPLLGSPADIAALAGEWSGEYFSGQAGRSGSITFSILPGKDTAYGDVVMTPWRGQPVVAADVEARGHAMHAAAPEVLKVEFVRIVGGSVRGRLEPYIAPDCGCVVTTIFQGALRDNTIRGRYVTTGTGGFHQEGDWTVTRKLVAGR